MSEFRKRLLLRGGDGKYIKFRDPIVAKICAEKWGNGIGITYKQALDVTDIGTTFNENSKIINFEELEEFGVTRIPKNAFRLCVSLKTVCSSKIKIIEATAFDQSGVEKVFFPNVEELGFASFYMTHIDEICFPKLMKISSESCFQGSHIKKVKALGNIKALPNKTFADCKELVEVTLPKRLETIGNNVFYQSDALEIVNSFPISVRSIGNMAFRPTEGRSWNVKLDICELPNLMQLGQISLENIQFSRIINLGKITILNFATFVNCNWIEELILPHTIISLAERVFDTTSPMNVVRCYSLTPPTITSSSFKNIGTIYVPDESVELYKTSPIWSAWRSKIFPISDYITFEDITSYLQNNVVYNTALEVYAQFDDTEIGSEGAMSMIYELDGTYDTLKISGSGGTDVWLYCFIDENNEVITTSDESLVAYPLYICVPTMAKKMVICSDVSEVNVKVEIGKHI